MLVAAVMFVPALASAEIKLYGQLDVWGYATDGTWGNAAGYDKDSDTNIRAFVGANFGLQENIEANVALLYSRYWGDTQTTGKDVNSTLDEIRIAEANIVFKNLFDNDRISAKIGRYFYGEKGDSIFYIGLRDLVWYNPQGWSYFNQETESGMDGLLVTYDDREKLKVDAGYSKLSSNINSSQKASIFFANAKYIFNDMISLRGYIYDFEYISGRDKDRWEYIGLKPEVKLLDNALTVSLEVAQQFYDDTYDGRTPKAFQNYAEAYLAKLDAKYSVNEALDVRGMYLRTGEYFYSPLNNVYLGLVGTTCGWVSSTLSYLEVINLGADYKLNKFVFSADYFRQNDTEIGYYYPSYEIDLVAAYNYTENIVFKLGAGYFGEEQGDGSADVIYNFGASWKFGNK